MCSLYINIRQCERNNEQAGAGAYKYIFRRGLGGNTPPPYIQKFTKGEKFKTLRKTGITQNVFVFFIFKNGNFDLSG